MSENSSERTLRGTASQVLTVLGVIALVVGATLGQVRRGLFESDAFADRLASSLSDPRVSAYVGQEIADEAIRKKPDLVAVRPILVATASGVVSSDAFRAIVRTTARSAHATAFSKGGQNLLLSVPDVDVILRGALANASPAIAARIPDRLPTVIASLGESPATRFILDLWQSGRHLAWTARALALGGIALLVLGIVLAPRRAEALRSAAIDLALAGLFLALVIPAARSLVSSLPKDPLAQHAAAGLFEAFSIGLRHLALGLAGVGLVFAAAAQSLVGRAWLPETVERLGAWLRRPPASAWGRFLRGAVLMAGGILMMLRPAAAVAMLGLVAGAVVAFLGLQELFRLVVRQVPEEERPATASFGRRERKRVAAVLGLALVLAAAVAWVGQPPEVGIARVSTGCNGDERLCDRTLDAVVLPGAHNAMSSVDAPDWMFPQQERGVADSSRTACGRSSWTCTPGSRSPGASAPTSATTPRCSRRCRRRWGRKASSPPIGSARGSPGLPRDRAASTSATASASWGRCPSCPGCARCASSWSRTPARSWCSCSRTTSRPRTWRPPSRRAVFRTSSTAGRWGRRGPRCASSRSRASA